MNPKLFFCLALVFSAVVLGCSPTANHTAAIPPAAQMQKQAGERAWQTTLHDAVTNAAAPWMVPVFSGGNMHYTVPAEAAKLLESQPPAELLPFLAKLRREPPPWKAGIVDGWTVIVRGGLRGTPGVITNTSTTAKGITSTMEIPVWEYTVKVGIRQHGLPSPATRAKPSPAARQPLPSREVSGAAMSGDFAWPGQTNSLPALYVHFGAGGGDSTKRLLSTRVHLGEDIFAGGDDYWKLTGHIEQRGTNLVAELEGNTGHEGEFYRGNMTLEQPVFPQGGAASGFVGAPRWFAVSTN